MRYANEAAADLLRGENAAEGLVGALERDPHVLEGGAREEAADARLIHRQLQQPRQLAVFEYRRSFRRVAAAPSDVRPVPVVCVSPARQSVPACDAMFVLCQFSLCLRSR